MSGTSEGSTGPTTQAAVIQENIAAKHVDLLAGGHMTDRNRTIDFAIESKSWHCRTPHAGMLRAVATQEGCLEQFPQDIQSLQLQTSVVAAEAKDDVKQLGPVSIGQEGNSVVDEPSMKQAIVQMLSGRDRVKVPEKVSEAPETAANMNKRSRQEAEECSVHSRDGRALRAENQKKVGTRARLQPCAGNMPARPGPAGCEDSVAGKTKALFDLKRTLALPIGQNETRQERVRLQSRAAARTKRASDRKVSGCTWFFWKPSGKRSTYFGLDIVQG